MIGNSNDGGKAKIICDFPNARGSALVELLKKGFAKIKEDLIPFFEKLIEDLKTASNANIDTVNVEMLDKTNLVEIAKKYMVKGCNEVAAFKKVKDDDFYVYIAYSKDRELLPIETNHYVVIKSDGLSKEVKELFNESDLIILK